MCFLTVIFKETEGVPVITFGETDDFPGFFTRTSGCKSPYSFNDEYQIASIISKNNTIIAGLFIHNLFDIIC